MDNQINFVFKVLLISAGLAAAIRYLAPRLNIPATPVNALIMVFLPMLLVAIGLGWRSRRKPTISVSVRENALKKPQEGKFY
jgi:hypothetical protein